MYRATGFSKPRTAIKMGLISYDVYISRLASQTIKNIEAAQAAQARANEVETLYRQFHDTLAEALKEESRKVAVYAAMDENEATVNRLKELGHNWAQIETNLLDLVEDHH
jgi:hypothetical protein